MPRGDRHRADQALVVALASGQTVQDAAAAAGVSESTAFRRLRDPDFARRVSLAQGELAARGLGRLAEGMACAADTLRALLGDSTPPAVRLGAARALLELSMRLRESVDLEQRLAALESRLKAGKTEVNT